MKQKGIKVAIFISIIYILVNVIWNQNYFFKLPFQNIAFENVVDSCKDQQGRVYVGNSSGYEILCVDSENVVFRISEKFSGDSGFVQADFFAVDENGHLFVHNRMSSDQAYAWFGGESIIEFDQDGKYIATYEENIYDAPRVRTSIFDLESIRGEMCYFYAEDDSLYIKSCNGTFSRTYHYPHADRNITSAVYSPDEDCAYVITLDGKLEKLQGDTVTLIYQASGEKSLEIPKDISISEDGEIFVSDIGVRAIYKLERTESEQSDQMEYLPYIFAGEYVTDAGANIDENHRPSYDSSEVAEQLIPYRLNAVNGLVYSEVDQISLEVDGKIFSFSGCKLGSFEVVRYVSADLAILFVILLLMLLLFVLIRKVILSEGIKDNIICGITVGGIALTALFISLSMKNFNERFVNQMFKQQDFAVQMVNQLMPIKAFKNLDGVEDFGSEDYLEVKKTIDSIILDEDGVPGDLYLVVYSLEEEGMILRYSVEEVQGCWYPYYWYDEGIETIYEKKEKHTFYGNDVDGSFMLVMAPILDEDGTVLGVVEVGTDLTVFREQNRKFLFDLFLNISVVLVVTILVLLELIVFIDARNRYREQTAIASSEAKVHPPVDLMRIAVFTVFFVTNITTPFLSIYGVQLSNKMGNLFGISPEIWAAVPISAEVLFGALFSMFGNRIIQALGNRKAGILAGIIFTLGLCIRFLMPNLWILTLGNAIQGAGWGIFLLIINVDLSKRPEEEEREQGFSGYNIALQNGMNSGIVVGGFLLMYMEYNSVLMIVALLSVLLTIYAWFYIKDEDKSSDDSLQEEDTSTVGFKEFMFNRKVLAYYICIVVPIVAASYYLNYLYPLLGEKAGMSESHIGYSYLLNGMVVICFSNLIVKAMSKYFNKRMLILLASILYTVCFVMIGLSQSVPVLLVVLILLAVSDSFGYVAQSIFYTDLNIVEAYGYDKAAGIYSLMENISQTAGPFLFGYILTMGLRNGMLVYGGLILIMGLLFFIATHDKKKEIQE